MFQRTDTSQINFDLLFKNHPIPMWIYDLKTLAFLEMNDAAVKKYGYSRKKFSSMTLKDITPEEDVQKILKEVSKNRPALQNSGIWRHKLKSGKVIDVEINSNTINYNGRKAVLVTAQDITERKKIEEEKFVFSNVIENSLNELYVFDIDSLRFRNVNKGARKNLGYSIDELLQMTPLDLKPEFTKESFEKLIKPLRNKKKDKIEFTTVHRRKDGSLYPVEVHLSINHKEKVFSAVILDITERKRSEEKIYKLNRVYTLLSEINQLIVRTQDASKITETVCRIAVEKGGFVMSWIGMIDEKENKVRVTASAGVTGDYLSNINIDLNDKERSSGPTGRAIKTMKHVVSNNIDKDKKMIPWQKDAAKYGYKSSAAFPINVFGKAAGVFNLYSANECFFDEEETKLLDEMAKDISFALEFIEEEKERKMTEEALRESEANLQIILESTADGILVVDNKGKVIKTNKRFADLWKIPPSVLSSKDDSVLLQFVLNQLTEPQQFLNKVRQLYNSMDENLDTLLFKDGRVYERFSTPLLMKNKIVGRVWSFRDITERRRAEESLRESEERLRTIIETEPECVKVVDRDGQLLEMNTAGLTMLEAKSLSEAQRHTLSSFILPEYRASFNALHKRVMSGESGYLEFEVTGLRGTRRWLETHAAPMRDTTGEVTKLLGVTRDITERKQAEEEIRKSREDLLKFFEDDISANFISTPSGKLLQINRAFLKLFGFNSKEEALDFPAEKLYLVHSDRNRFIDLFKKKKRIENFENEYISRDGRIIYVLENAIGEFDKAGKLIQIRGYIVDITERKKAEEELRKLSRAVEQGPASVVITNPQGEIEYVNQKFCTQSGFSREEVTGKNLRILNSGHHDEKFFEELWNTIISGREWRGEILNKKKNGELYWDSTLISPLVNNTGDVTHFVSIQEDITEKKKMLDELIMAKENAESANRLKDAFIANISHEIRTPLSGILGMTNLIKDSFSRYSTEEEKEYFAGIDHSSKRIIRTVDMILNFSRLQIGEFSVTPKETDISAICQNLIHDYIIAAKIKSLELTFENQCGDSTIFADEYSTTEAISNLIDNAIKYTNKGYVKVILYRGKNDEIMLDITDSGIGIAEENLENIFEPYRQEQMGYGRTYEGVGLGLSLVKKFLELNNADIFVESKKGEGTTFTIKFGKNVQSMITGNLVNEDLPAGQAGTKTNEIVEKKDAVILIVEDDEINQVTIRKLIENKYRTLITDSSDKAMELLKTNKVDLILMDISIKGTKNGLELTKELKVSKEFSHIPIITVTAHAFEQDRLNALEAGCNVYISKPFTKKLLLDTVARFV